MSSSPAGFAPAPAPAAAVGFPSAPSRHQSARLYRALPFTLGAALARIAPLPVLRRLGSWAGGLYARTHPEKVAVVRDNLRLLDPSHDLATARRVYASFGATMADYFHIGTRPPAKAARLIVRTDGEEHLRAARDAGKGALLVTGHLGLFELGGLATVLAGLPCAAVSLPEPSPALTAWRNAFRAGWGVETIEVGTGPFSCLEVAERLRAGGCVAALVDRPRPEGAGRPTLVSLPNGVCPCTPDIVLVALQCGAPILPTAMVRDAGGRYRATIFPPLSFDAGPDRAETLRRAAQLVADALIPLVRAHPEQWYQFAPLSAPLSTPRSA